MVKKLLIGLSVFALLLMLALTYITARFVDREAILAAQVEAKQLRASRDSILAFAAQRDTLQQELRGWVGGLETEARVLRAKVDSFEQARRESQLAVRRLRSSDSLEQKLHRTFPEVSLRMRVTEVHDQENDVTVQYLAVPLWFAETFVLDHQNAASFQTQRDTLLVVDSLRTQIGVLKDSILHLEEQKSGAFRAGYDTAYAKYEALNERHIALLQKPPRVSLGLPAWTTLLGSAGAGVLVGTLINKD